jgi:ribosomal protein L37AE/L43A
VQVVNLAWLKWECEDCHKTNLTLTANGIKVFCNHCGAPDIVPLDTDPNAYTPAVYKKNTFGAGLNGNAFVEITV